MAPDARAHGPAPPAEAPALRPWYQAAVVVLACAVPAVLVAAGVDLGIPDGAPLPGEGGSLTPAELADAAYRAVRGDFTHMLLEWSAFGAAVLVGVLTIVHHRLTREPTVLILGTAIVCAGLVDAFHAVAADRLLGGAAGSRDVVPFAWAVSRMFHAAILLVGVACCVAAGSGRRLGRSGWVVLGISAGFVAASYWIVHLCATSGSLPRTMFPGHWVRRPYDVYPLVLFVFCGAVVLPRYLRAHRSPFAYALLLSMLPQIATQLYMAFGSERLYDPAFNAAHVTKIFAFVLPAAGLLVQYVRDYADQKQIADAFDQKSSELLDRTRELEVARTRVAASARFSEALNRADVESVYRSALTCIADSFGARWTALYTIGADAELACRSAVRAEVGFLESGDLSIRGLAAEVAREGEPVTVPGPLAAPDGGAPVDWIRAWPVTCQDECAGVLVVAGGGEPTPEQLAFVDACLEQLGIRVYSFRVDAVRQELVEHLREQSIALSQAKEEAEHASRAMGRFLANMSHEIRTPMTAILGYTDLLLGPDLSDSERRDSLETVRRNGEHLLSIINDILDLSKIESGQMTIDRVRCSPYQVVRDVIVLLRHKARAAGLCFELECAGEIPERVTTDPLRLKQILLNLVGNALKFTEAGEVRVVLRMETEAGTGAAGDPALCIDVADTGIGIEPDKLEDLFDPFVQADTSTTRHFGGTGLGLAISRQLCKLLGGSLTVRSTPGEGSTFTVRIGTGPMAGVRMVSDPTTADTARASSPRSRLDVRLEARVLLVEDSPDNQRLIGFVLQKAGAEVSVADNGQLALEMAAAAADIGEPFDLILMDIQMPTLDGYEATQALRRRGFQVPIIALTANAMDGSREQCLRAGCDDFLSKPIQREKLLERVAQHLRRGAAGARTPRGAAPSRNPAP